MLCRNVMRRNVSLKEEKVISAVKLQYIHQEVYQNDLSLLTLEKIETKKFSS